MPIIIEDFTWRQCENIVTIVIPLKGVHSSKVDIFTMDSYVKAHFPPFIFETFLYSGIDESKSKCTISEEEVVFELHKMQSEMWETLHANISKDRKRELKQIAIQKAQEKSEAETQFKLDKKDKLQKLAVRQQIILDSQEREKINQMKKSETDNAMRELEEWKLTRQTAEKGKSLRQSNAHIMNHIKPPAMKATAKFESALNRFEKCENRPMPLLRRSGHITVNFTTRAFPTPSRESQHEEEQEWLKNQATARRSVGFVAEDLRPEEQDPQWLKEKGDSFFETKNYLGAISAYSHAIKLGSTLPALFSNRAAAHMGLGNLHKTVEDCTRALELLTPCVSLNALSRARCYARRGTALCRLGLPKHGVVDLEAALVLQPNDDKLISDIETAQFLVSQQENSDEECVTIID